MITLTLLVVLVAGVQACESPLPAGSPTGRAATQPVDSPSVTYYVRPDGSSPEQCTGQAAATYT